MGSIRGISKCKLDFEYPISAIAGTNGSGKSTLLAMATCAFHNGPKGYTPALRAQTYYTFRDFFIQSDDETPIQGVEIRYGIRHNAWRGQKRESLGFQIRTKRKGGRWNDYKTRVKRNVIYFGAQRVVPHFERSVHKSYRSRFKPGNLPQKTKIKIAKLAGRIIGKPYANFDRYEHGKYSLPRVTSAGVSYTGFNLGAGESAVFEILTALFQAGPGTLVVIDEIELGLHEKAQMRLLKQLKELCWELKCQVICSTHSHAVLNSLPPKARFFIEKVASKTLITKGISADFACGKMGKPNAEELDIFVEDGSAATIVEQMLPLSIRKRCKIHAIGSHSAVLRQLASRYLEGINNSICILDGDQSREFEKAAAKVADGSEASTSEKRIEITAWAKDKIYYLPGNAWPEKWLLETAINALEKKQPSVLSGTAKEWGLSNDGEILEILQEANSADKHDEFFEISELVKLDADRVREDVCRLVLAMAPNEFDKLITSIGGKRP